MDIKVRWVKGTSKCRDCGALIMAARHRDGSNTVWECVWCGGAVVTLIAVVFDEED